MSIVATVLIPTHDHGETLRHAVASVQGQTLQDFEILIVGDGVPDGTRRLASELCAQDGRIRFFDRPKGERRGETLRHQALQEAQGSLVAYLCDDDLWMPSHLQHVRALLCEADAANTAVLSMQPSGEGLIVTFDCNDPWDRENFRRGVSGAGLSSFSHTMAAYRSLPFGWRTTPPDIATDVYMEQQFFDWPGIRWSSSTRASVVRFGSEHWKDEAPDLLLAALRDWSARIAAPGAESDIAWALFRKQANATAHPATTVRNWPYRRDVEFAPYHLGDGLDFSKSSDRQRYLSWGWSIGESWGVWCDGDEARVTLRPDASPPAGLILEADVRVGDSGRPTRLLRVAVNGEIVATWDLAAGPLQKKSCRVAAAERLDIRFLIQGAAQASVAHTPWDHRRLGVGLGSLRLREFS